MGAGKRLRIAAPSYSGKTLCARWQSIANEEAKAGISRFPDEFLQQVRYSMARRRVNPTGDKGQGRTLSNKYL
jgi:hypothetical protein